MSILKPVTRFPQVARQCIRAATVHHQSRRGYADMSFTFASSTSVSDIQESSGPRGFPRIIFRSQS